MHLLSKITTTFFAFALSSLIVAVVANPVLHKPEVKQLEPRAKGKHDWHECLEIHIHNMFDLNFHRKRWYDVSSTVQYVYPGEKPRKIPDLLPEIMSKKLECHPVPSKVFNDAHCGNVFETVYQACHKSASATRLGITPVNDKYGHNDMFTWIAVMGFEKYFQKTIDDFYVNITETPDCHPDGTKDEDTQWMKGQDNFDLCMQLMWNAWAMCDNKGRGGSITAGCWNFNLTTIN